MRVHFFAGIAPVNVARGSGAVGLFDHSLPIESTSATCGKSRTATPSSLHTQA